MSLLPPATTRPRGDTRERLLRAAVELFDRHGFEGTSMRDLASAVGLKAPALYNHFSSKEEILLVAVTTALEEFNHAVVDPDDVRLTPLERLDGLVQRHVEYQIVNVQLARSNDRLLTLDIVDRLEPAVRKRIRATMRSYLDTMTEIVTLAAANTPDPSEARLAALGIAAMCDHVNDWYRPDGRQSAVDLGKTFSRFARGVVETL